jgi:TolA-binding protein
MGETVDLTLLAGGVQGLERETRLLRLQLDHLAGTVPPRLGGIEARLQVMEQSVHDLATEVARSFGQVQQQLTRAEKRFDGLEAGLAALQAQIAESTDRLMGAIAGGGTPA